MMKKIFLNKLGKLSLAEKVQKASGDAANQEEAASTLKPTAGKWDPGYASAGCSLNWLLSGKTDIFEMILKVNLNMILDVAESMKNML